MGLRLGCGVCLGALGRACSQRAGRPWLVRWSISRSSSIHIHCAPSPPPGAIPIFLPPHHTPPTRQAPARTRYLQLPLPGPLVPALPESVAKVSSRTTWHRIPRGCTTSRPSLKGMPPHAAVRCCSSECDHASLGETPARPQGPHCCVARYTDGHPLQTRSSHQPS